MFDPEIIETLAEVLRGLKVAGKPVFIRVFTEVVDGHIHLDIEGVGGELYFPLKDDHQADAEPEAVPGRWYCVDCDTIYTGVRYRSQIPCYATHDVKKLSDVTWRLLCEKYGPVVAAEGAPRVVDLSALTITHEQISQDEADQMAAFISASAVYYGISALERLITVDAQPVPRLVEVDDMTVAALDNLIFSDKPQKIMLPGPSHQWQVSNGFLPIDAEEEE